LIQMHAWNEGIGTVVELLKQLAARQLAAAHDEKARLTP
jgi:hypothetical protein